MKAKKLLAALGVLILAAPGVAFAASDFKEESTVVEGKTVFAAVEEITNVNFAAVAGKASKRTEFGGVAWFNNQDLFASSRGDEKAFGNYVIATLAGDDDPSDHFGPECGEVCAAFVESYQLTDPNGHTWLVDRYDYRVCGTYESGTFHPLPCEPDNGAQAANDAGAAQDLDGDNNADVSAGQYHVLRSMFVVQIGNLVKNTAARCDAASYPELDADYNFLLLVRTDRVGDLQDGPGGKSASLDLWFSETRPDEPSPRPSPRIADSSGAGTCTP